MSDSEKCKFVVGKRGPFPGGYFEDMVCGEPLTVDDVCFNHSTVCVLCRDERSSKTFGRVCPVCREKGITPAQWANLRMNSYERLKLYPFLDDNALAELAERFRANCRQMYRPDKPAVSYDESLIHEIVPLLCERIKKLSVRHLQ